MIILPLLYSPGIWLICVVCIVRNKIHWLRLDTCRQLKCFVMCSFRNAMIVGPPVCPHKQSIVTLCIYLDSKLLLKPTSCKRQCSSASQSLVCDVTHWLYFQCLRRFLTPNYILRNLLSQFTVHLKILYHEFRLPISSPWSTISQIPPTLHAPFQ